MDTLPLAIERVIFGANIDVEQRRVPNGNFLGEQLEAAFLPYEKRLGEVKVRVASDTKVEIQYENGSSRTLVLEDDTWTLVNLAARPSAKTPGQISVILASP